MLFALTAGVLLVALATFVALLTRQRTEQIQRTRWAIQARLNAYSGFYRVSSGAEMAQPLDLGSAGSCLIEIEDGHWIFRGRCRGIERVLRAPQGQLRRVREVSP